MIGTQAVGFVAAFALIMIGVFSEDYGAPHVFWSEVFFILNLIWLFASVSLMTHPGFIRPIGYYGLTVAVINLPFIVLLEWFTVFTALGSVALLSYNTLRLPQTS
jgi:hypothetical membrane protein